MWGTITKGEYVNILATKKISSNCLWCRFYLHFFDIPISYIYITYSSEEEAAMLINQKALPIHLFASYLPSNHPETTTKLSLSQETWKKYWRTQLLDIKKPTIVFDVVIIPLDTKGPQQGFAIPFCPNHSLNHLDGHTILRHIMVYQTVTNKAEWEMKWECRKLFMTMGSMKDDMIWYDVDFCTMGRRCGLNEWMYPTYL